MTPIISNPSTRLCICAKIFLSDLASRESRIQWEDEGKKRHPYPGDGKSRQALGKENPARFSEDLDKRIKDHFPGIVAGDAKW